MKYPIALIIAFLSASVISTPATVILDDTFADGTRINQNLPTDSAWYVSTPASWTTTVGSMSLAMSSTAIQAVTYFGANSSSPVQLSVGDTLTVSIKFTLSGLPALSGSQNFRVGVFDFADSTLTPKWATADLSSNNGQGNGVAGYALMQSMGAQFNNVNPMSVQKRTTLADSGLLGTSGDYTVVANGPGSTNGFAGFLAGTQYLLQLTLLRSNSTTMVITASWLNITNGATLTTTGVDTGATSFNFDGIGFRPSAAATTASTIVFNEVTVDVVSANSPPSIDSSPDDQSVIVGQDAGFTVFASGSAPLGYQWYFNTNTPVSGATNNSLFLTNIQLTNAGTYHAVVTNAYGSATSSVASLTVNLPTAPSVVTQPQNLTVLPGESAVFTVAASGTQPLSYQWFFNTNSLLTNATDATLTITNSQVANAGTYSVVITNVAGTVTSSNAILSLNTNPVAPVFTTQPSSVVAVIGSTASFVSLASGSAPITYQWSKNGVPIPGEISSTLTITNVQATNSGSYSVTASNNVNSVISVTATLSVSATLTIPNSAFNLTGFGRLTTGGGFVAETNSTYLKVYTPLDLANALRTANKTAGAVRVIEIMTNLDLGWNEVGPAVQGLDSNPFRQHATPKLHPRLLTTGVSLIDIKAKGGGLTIFSANGSTIRHACFNVKGTGNIIIRNLKFDELWEWDEASKGKFDGNDWDFIDLGNAGTVSNIWIDHCTFTKTYDGQTDIKQGSWNITFSWCKYTGDDGATNANSWVRQQIASLEANKASYPMYNFLRTKGFSQEDVVTIVQGHDKTHLIGANDGVNNAGNAAENARHTVTFHHDWFLNPWDRLPRLRGGNVHNYNIYVDDTAGLAAKRLRDAKANAMSTADRNSLNNTYSFNPFLNGSISTENGAVLVEKSVYKDCLTPLRNNQTDPSNPQYTGKIMALDTIYQMDSTVVRGNSTNAGNPLGPFQAPVIPFSWNQPGNQLPYTYTMDDPGQLQGIVQAGAGAGALTWDKTNWLITAYAATAPSISSQPSDLTVTTNQNATFIVVAGGSSPLQYQWFFNTNTPVGGATNAVFTLLNAQTTNAGKFSVVITNSAGSVTSVFASLIISNATVVTGFAAWQSTNFTAPQLADTNISGPDATPAGDGVANVVKYALGLAPFTFAPQPLFGFRVESGEGILSYNRPVYVLDVLYRIEVSTDLTGWTTNGVSQQPVSTNGAMQVWEGTFSGPPNLNRFFRLLFIH